MPKRILIAANEIDRAKPIELVLQLKRFGTVIATTHLEVIANINDKHVDLVILDTAFRDIDSLQLCQQIREISDLPILLITPHDKTNILDFVIKGLEFGADDYITEPIDPEELLARVRAHLRRIPSPAKYPLQGKCVFISYARPDTAFVDWLSEQLENQSIATWVDRENIRPGDIWDDKVDEALRECDAMILVLSPYSVKSTNVSDEWKFFMGTLNRPVIPILWQDCTPHFRLVHLQYIDFRNYREGAIDELVAALEAHLER